MNKVCNMTLRMQRSIVSLFVPVSLMICGQASLIAAHSRASVPVQANLAEERSAAPEPATGKAALELRSLSHPFPPVSRTEEGDLIASTPGYGFFQASVAVAAGEKAVWYSAGANRIRCSLLLPNVTWLGTEAGLKRLDPRAGTVQHFCTLDGLPYNRITAVAGQERELYCTAVQMTAEDARRLPNEADPHHTTVALCRFHADSGKWEPIAEQIRSYPQGLHVAPPAQSKAKAIYGWSEHASAEQQYITVGGDRACLALGPGTPGQTLVLVSPVHGGGVERILCPGFAPAPFRISFASADADGIWIGSDLGLLHYDFKGRRWERLLSDLVVTGGCAAKEGGLWLLTQRFDPDHQDRDGNSVQTEHCQVTRWAPNKDPEHFAILDKENRENVGSLVGAFSNIVAAGNKVWTTEDRFLSGGHAQWTYYPAVYSLDLDTRKVALEVPFAGGEKQYVPIPDAVLANALTGFGAPVPLSMPARFPGWRCPVEEKSLVRPTTPLQRAGSGVAADDGQWYTQGESGAGGPEGSYWRQVLKHVGNRGEERERYVFPSFRVATHEPVSSPVVRGEKVYFLSQPASLRLYIWDRRTDGIVPVPEMDDALTDCKPDSGTPCRLMSDGDSIWIGTGWAVLRYQLKTRQVDVWKGDKTQSRGWTEPYSLLSVEGGKAWIKGAPNRLLTASDPAAHEQMVPVLLPPFPAEVEQDLAEAALFAKADGIVWFQTKSAAAPRHPVLIGYRMQTRTWTKPYEGRLSAVSTVETVQIVKQGPVQWFYGSSCALGFNTETEQWQTLPAIPLGMQAAFPHLAAVEVRNAWVLSESHLLHLDRVQNRWTSEEMPFQVDTFRAPPGVRDGSSLFVPTHLGLWAVDLITKQVRQSPPILSSDRVQNYQVVATDHNAVWILGGRLGDSFLVRFDRNAYQWHTVPAQHELAMAQHTAAQWSADGESCWMQTLKDTYHLDTKTNRWENISARLASKLGRSAFQQIVPDGEDVWLVAATLDEHYAPLAHPPAIPLYRYHIKTDTFVPVSLSSGAPLLPNLLTINRDSVLLTTSVGSFRLDRAANRWKTLPPPALPIGIPPLKTLVIYEESGSYWFVGTDNTLHLTK